MGLYSSLKAIGIAALALALIPTPEANAAPKQPLFGANLSGAEAKGGDAIRPSLEDWKGYVDRHGFKLIRYPFKDDG